VITAPEYKNVLSIDHEVRTDGHSPLLVIADDFKKYIIKSTRGQSPSYNIINEFLCGYLLKLWEIPVPEFAALTLNPDLLAGRAFSDFHKPHFYQNITFGSRCLDTAIEMGTYLRIHNRIDLRKLHNASDLIKIGLFDIWIENTDRKPTNNNILISIAGNHLTINAIDHAFTFDSLSYSDLNTEYIVNTWNDNILETDLAKDILTILKKDHVWSDWVRQFEDKYYLCIENCQQNYDSIVTFIPDELGFDTDLSKYVHDFLFNEKRNKNVFTEFLSRIS
jgi:hypothetical protein